MRKVTFYQFESLEQCAFKGLSKLLILDGTLPKPIPSQFTLVGLFHHKALELAATVSSVEQLDKRIEEEIRLLAAQVRQWPHLNRLGNVSAWDEINRSVGIARRLLEANSEFGRGVLTRGVEVELRSKDGLMEGRPDYFVIRNTDAILREYKSVPIRDADGSAIGTYMDQVLFYAVLLFDNYDIKTVVATIESITGDTIPVTVQPSVARSIADRVRGLLTVVNQRLEHCSDPTKLGTASVNGCSYCPMQIMCESFKSNEAIQLALPGQSICEGEVLSLRGSDADSSQTVEIADKYRNTSITLLVPREHATGITVGRRFVLQNLRRHGGRLCWGSTSRALSSE